MRTPEALDCLEAIAGELPDVVAGAGTVLNESQAREAIARGAEFIVSPGLDDGVVDAARKMFAPVFPGISTATEAQRAFNLGLDTVKFFPASIAGGPPAIKALGSVFRSLKFMPTGGISPDNLTDYLALPSVLACGGSWLTPSEAIDRGDFSVIAKLAIDALERARTVRS
jgi:2-dehydro-3-deoxyphosphogluconate aldolase/(4S)-4-hydroxy-2-oxoglutarate aldolase